MRLSICFLCFLLAAPAGATDIERNKDLVRRMTEAINQRNFDALDELVAANVQRHSAATPGVEVHSLDDFKAYLRQDLSSVPDAQQEIRLMLAEGDKVAVRAIYRGTQTGPMGPFPPSGKSLELPFMGILRIENGKIAEIWVEWDNISALTQLGHFPPPESAGAAAGTAKEEANKALARRWFDEVINQRNVDAIDDIYAADYAYHGLPGPEMRGLDNVKAFAASILAASEDRHAVVDQQVVEGDLVVTRFTSRGKHTGTWQGRNPTGKIWTTQGIVISRIAGGKIVEDWEIIANSGL